MPDPVIILFPARAELITPQEVFKWLGMIYGGSFFAIALARYVLVTLRSMAS